MKEEGRQETERTWKPKAAGILCIIAGVVYVPISIPLNVLGLIMIVVSGEPGGSGEFPIAFAVTMWILPVLAIIAIVGGVHALRRRRWRLALTGAICMLIPGVALGGIGAWFFSASSPVSLAFVVFASLALLPLIFVIRGKREFK